MKLFSLPSFCWLWERPGCPAPILGSAGLPGRELPVHGELHPDSGSPFLLRALSLFHLGRSSQGVSSPDNLRHPGHPKANTCHPCPHRCPRAHRALITSPTGTSPHSLLCTDILTVCVQLQVCVSWCAGVCVVCEQVCVFVCEQVCTCMFLL